MANVKEILEKISSISLTKQITSAMKMVSVSKLNKIQNEIARFYDFYNSLEEIFSNINLDENDLSLNKFLSRRNLKKVGFVVLSSDKGMCGGFNSSLFKFVKNSILEFKEKFGTVNSIICLGEKSRDQFYQKDDLYIIKDYIDLMTNFNIGNVKSLSLYLINRFFNKDFDKIFIIYNKYKSISVSYPVIEPFLPLDFEFIKKSFIQKEEKHDNFTIFESSKEETFDIIFPRYLEMQIYGSILSSKASENASRMINMSKAVDNSDFLLKNFVLQKNRIRQNYITQEISEIVAGVESLN